MVEAMTETGAVRELERLAKTLAWRLGMVSGFITVAIGAGNPDYFYDICYKQDGYGPSGTTADSPEAIMAHGPTLVIAVGRLLEAVNDHLDK